MEIDVNGFEVRIAVVDNGFVASVGCQTFVFTDKEAMLEKLSAYLDNPSKMVKEYCNMKQPKEARQYDMMEEL